MIGARLVVGAILGATLVAVAGCASAPVVFAPKVDRTAARNHADDALGDPATAAKGHLHRAWLCLLHGVDCAALTRHARGAVVHADDMVLAQLTRALAGQVTGSIQARALAWLDLLTWLDVHADRSQRAADLRTAALQAVERLAVRDRKGVQAAIAARGQACLSALQRDDEVHRWRRIRALSRVVPGVSRRRVLAASPALDLHVTAVAKPWNRRPFTGLRGDTGLPPDSARVAVVVARPDRPGRYRLAVATPGTWTAHAAFIAPSGPHTLVLDAPGPFRAWLDGKLVVDALDHRSGARAHTVAVKLGKGPHHLAIAAGLLTAGAGIDLAVLRAVPPSRRKVPRAPQWPSVVRSVVAALAPHASSPHADQARRAIAARYPDGPLAAMLDGRRHASLSDHTPRASTATLDRLLDHFPSHVDARIERAARARDDGDGPQAKRLIASIATAETSPGRVGRESAQTTDLPIARRADRLFEIARQHLGNGLADLAVAAVLRAVREQPDDCAVWSRAVEIAMDAMQRPTLVRLLALRGTCTHPSVAAADALIAIGRLDEAAVELAAAATDVAAREEAAGRLADLATTRGRIRKRAKRRPVPRDAVWRSVQRGLVDSRKAERAKAAKSLDRLLVAPGRTSMETRRSYFLLGARPPWRSLRVDGAAAVEAWQAKCSGDKPGPACNGNGAPITWLVDHEIAVLLPDGGAIRRVHQVAIAHSARAAESLGEITVPSDAELVDARTYTADGKVLLPAATPDKETVSLRGVAPGAAVEFIQVQFVGADDPATGATRLSPFMLQSTDGPVVASTYIVMTRDPGDRPPADRSPTAPPVFIGKREGWRTFRWQTRDLPRLRPEPRAARPAWTRPAVRVHRRATFASIVERFEETLAAFSRSNDPILAPWQRRARAAGQDAQRWRQLIARIASEVRFARSGSAPGSPAAAVRDGRGDRATLLWYLARHAGVSACLVRWRPLDKTPSYGAPDPRDYSATIVRLQLRHSGAAPATVWIDPGVDGGIVDYLRPGARGRPGLLLGCPSSPSAAQVDRRIVLPDVGASLDARAIAINVHWRADGSAQATVTDTMNGALAALVRSYLVAAPNSDQQRDKRKTVVRELAKHAFPGWTPTFRDARTSGTKLIVRYTAKLTRAPDPTRLSIGLAPARLGRMYARLPRRRTPLRFGHALTTTVSLTVTQDGGRFSKLPAAITATDPRASFQRTVGLRGPKLQIRTSTRASMGIVPAAAYPPLARTLRKIDAAEIVVLRRQLRR